MEKNENLIKSYYEKLAQEYDQDRFNNTYGEYIDSQERAILNKVLSKHDINTTLDMACGTGRFLEYAKFGLDISPNMLKISHEKYPDKILLESSVLNTPFKDNSFSTIYSFHLIMHLDHADTSAFLRETARITQSGATLIFDFPSKDRRQMLNYKSVGWHASNALSVSDIEAMTSEWTVKKSEGILFFPIHRFPHAIRKYAKKIDTLLCRSFLKKYASYTIVILKKK